ncbi:AMP-binding enzyme [Aspergillus undulatus]|uniref:AMP-binding enzyme n=1 Tax=Aspergillus undulatus TaxID=1810928 RepID=UPI003CCDED3A
MAVFKSKYTVDAPATNLLTYLFDSPYKDEGAWPAAEPLICPSSSSPNSDRTGNPGYTVNEIKSLVKCLGNGLSNLGARNKNVIIYGDANIHFQLAVLGVIGAGATLNIRPQGSVEDLVSRLRVLGCDLVFCGPQAIETVSAAAEEVGIPKERLFVVDEFLRAADGGGGNISKTGVSHWSSLLEFPGGDEYQWPSLSPGESKTTTAVLIDTSGTTGISKLVERTHYGLIGNIEQVLQTYTLRERSHETILCNYRFCGMGFLLLGILIPLKARYRAIFPTQIDGHTLTETVERWNTSWVMLPKHLMREVLSLKPKPNLSCVKHVFTGGAMIPFELINEWQGAFGSQVQSVYGMSEAGFFTLPHPNDIVQDEDTGFLLPNVEAKILDNSGNLLPTNKRGLIHIRSPFVMTGYRGDPAKTAETVSSDGWIETGDVGWLDERERVHVVGREKDHFKVEGYTVTASEIETAILKHPGVRDVAVIPVTLPNDTEPVPRGYIVNDWDLKSGVPLTIDDFMAWMEKEVHPHLRLTGGVAFIQSIPISSGGNSKVDRQKLLQIAEEEMRLSC